MQPYIPYLLEDITAGHQPKRKMVCDAGNRNPNLADVIGEFECMRQEPGHTLEYFSGLSAEGFPPAEQLNNKEMLEVCRAFKKMMLSWKLKCSFPKGLPVRMVYALLIKALKRQIDPESSFSVVFGYCNLNPSTCLLEKYCTCLKMERLGIADKTSNDGKGAFIELGF